MNKTRTVHIDTPRISDSSKVIKKSKKDKIHFVQSKMKDNSRLRYLQLLHDLTKDNSNPPVWSRSPNSNGLSSRIKAASEQFSTPKQNITPQMYKQCQDFVVKGSVSLLDGELSSSTSNLPQKSLSVDQFDGKNNPFENKSKVNLPSWSSSISLKKLIRKDRSFTSPIGNTSFDIQNLFKIHHNSATSKVILSDVKSTEISPIFIPGKEVDPAQISTSSHVTPQTIDLIDSPPSSTPAHSPQSSSSLTQRSTSTPTLTSTAIAPSLTTTASSFTSKQLPFRLDLQALRLNESSDERLLEAEAKIHQAKTERVKASNDFASTSTIPPIAPFFPDFVPPLRTALPEEEEEEDEDDEEEGSEEILPDEGEKEVPSLPVIEEYIRPKISQATDETILITKFNIEIRRKDIETLFGLNWLNDEVINFYFQLIMQRSQKVDNLPKVYVFSTFFYDKLRASENSYATLKRWTRRVDIFSFDYILIPLHLGMHWALASINCNAKRICYYDSLTNTSLINQGGHVHQTAILKYLELEHKEKKSTNLPSDWTICAIGQDENGRTDVRIPEQGNGSDCGVFSCKFAECISRRAPFKFSQVIHLLSYFLHFTFCFVARRI